VFITSRQCVVVCIIVHGHWHIFNEVVNENVKEERSEETALRDPFCDREPVTEIVLHLNTLVPSREVVQYKSCSVVMQSIRSQFSNQYVSGRQ
jgi:hypothetical protein